jgi:N-acetylglucosamine-6-sulfatase
MKTVSMLTLCAICALCAALLLATRSLGAARAYVVEPGERPNVVIVMTDDQTLRSMRAMPRTRTLIGDAGATFANAFVNNPRCCPSRATFLTGQYSHNHGVLTNGPPIGGWERLQGTSKWLPTWLQRAGYRTAHVGKFLNNYGRLDPHEVPPGWDEWYATVDPTTYRYYGYTVNENGALRTYGGGQDPQWYSTDFISQRSADIVERLSPSTQPFFLSVAFLAPHTGSPHEPGDPLGIGTPAVAPRHRGAFSAAQLPQPASFDESDVSDKPASLRRPRLRPRVVAQIGALYRQRLESLIAVDEGVERIVQALRDARELERTLIVFTSDNGYLAGEHRLPHGKAKIYEPAIRVPLMVRGPGVPPAVRPSQLVTNADLSPTILDLAGASADRPQDGRSLLPLARNPDLGRHRALLIEVAKGAQMQTTAIRTARWLYAEHAAGARELYDLFADRQQLTSLHAVPSLAGVRASLAVRLNALRRCRGRECRTPVLPSELRPNVGRSSKAFGLRAVDTAQVARSPIAP